MTDGWTARRLKLLAALTMTLDHIGLWCNLFGLRQLGLPLRVVGRIAAPLFLFLLTESLRHTRSRKRLLLRLWLAGVLHAAVSWGLIRWTGEAEWYGNIFPTLFYTALIVTAAEDLRKGKPCFAVVLAGFAAGGVLTARGPLVLQWLVPPLWEVEYSLLFVALGVVWYACPVRKVQITVLLALSLCAGLIPADAAWVQVLGFAPMFYGTQWCMVLAAPLLYAYNGQRGETGRLPAYWSYWYYPLHQYALLLLAVLIKRA